MEKVKYGNYEFEMIPNGVDAFTADQLILRHKTGEMTTDQIETIVKDSSNTSRIEILDSTGGLLLPLEGYTVYSGIQKLPDYLIEEKQVADQVEEGQEQTYHTEEVRADIVVVTLKKTDVRDDAKEAKAIAEQAAANVAYVAMMSDIELEV